MLSFQRVATRARRMAERQMSLEEQRQIMAEIFMDVLGTQMLAKYLSGPTQLPPPHKPLAKLRYEQHLRHKEARERRQRQRDLETKYPGLSGENLARIIEQELFIAANRVTKKQKRKMDSERRVEIAQEKGPIGSVEFVEELKRLREEDTAADMAALEAKEAKKQRRSRKQTPKPFLFEDPEESENEEEDEEDRSEEEDWG